MKKIFSVLMILLLLFWRSDYDVFAEEACSHKTTKFVLLDSCEEIVDEKKSCCEIIQTFEIYCMNCSKLLRTDCFTTERFHQFTGDVCDKCGYIAVVKEEDEDNPLTMYSIIVCAVLLLAVIGRKLVRFCEKYEE